MTEIKGAQPKRRKLFGFLEVRGNRKEYWLWLGVGLATSAAIGYLFPQASNGLAGVLVISQVRRLHDIGRSGWWALAVQVASIIVALVLLPLAGTHIAVIAGALLVLGFSIWLGCVPGETIRNRFGEPPTKLFATA